MDRPPLSWRVVATGAAVMMLAACATRPPSPPPPPPPPPPPVVEEAVLEAIPYRPLPPLQADYQMQIPRRDANGVRVTINSGLAEADAIWHFRSGWNVAALNCVRPEHEPILEGYRTLLQRERRALAAANAAVERRFRQQVRTDRAALLAREEFTTGLYNYFATPPARSELCNAALAVANDYLANPPSNFTQFAIAGLAAYEAAFERFFTAYEAYEAASAEWDRLYGAQYGYSQPGWVAIHGDVAARVAAGMLPADALPAQPVPAASVIDPETGVARPVPPGEQGVASMPLVQPVPSAGAVIAAPQ